MSTLFFPTPCILHYIEMLCNFVWDDALSTFYLTLMDQDGFFSFYYITCYFHRGVYRFLITTLIDEIENIYNLKLLPWDNLRLPQSQEFVFSAQPIKYQNMD